MRDRWRFSRPFEELDDTERIEHLTQELERLSDYIDSLHKTVAYGPVPGAYDSIRLVYEDSPSPIATPVAFGDLVYVPSPRQVIAVAWTLIGSGAMSIDLQLRTTGGVTLPFTTIAGTDQQVGLINTAGSFTQQTIGNPSDPWLWMDLNNVVGTVDVTAALVQTKAAGKVEPA